MRGFILTTCLATFLTAAPAHALCFYRKADFEAGKARSFTTVPQEFRDSKWVVRAKVLSASTHYSDEDSWTIYRLRILSRLKGPPTKTLHLFTFRDSGGFYLDKRNKPDLDTEYLLFLNPPDQTLPSGVRDAVQINFSCGRSGPWQGVSAADRAWLAAHKRR